MISIKHQGRMALKELRTFRDFIRFYYFGKDKEKALDAVDDAETQLLRAMQNITEDKT